VTEFEIIERYFTTATPDPDVLLGVGDDAALLKVDGTIAVTVDTLVEGVHFPAEIPADALGYRTLAVNLSDLAAMGAEPRWCTLALTLPRAEPNWLEAFARGLLDLAARFGVSLVGGNLARGPLTATLQLMGRVPPEQAMRRSGGRPGDDVYVTGTLGDAAGGLELLKRSGGGPELMQRGGGGPELMQRAGGGPELMQRAGGGPELMHGGGPVRNALVERYLRPAPRVAAGLALRGLASAAIDVSDGLAADLGHLCRASGCGAAVDVARVPISAELASAFAPDAALAHALGGGDDYELCFTARPGRADRVEAAVRAAGVDVRRIGRLVDRAGGGIEWRREGAPYAPTVSGYSHF
jgi:thiamine-monophosphate kinase